MTGFNQRKIRHYANSLLEPNHAKNVDFRAILFRESLKASSSKDVLDATYSIKAASPFQGDSDNKKRSPAQKAKSPYNIEYGLVYDPNAKWAPGKYFKHYVTEEERKQAMQLDNPNPNWGWLDGTEGSNTMPVSNSKGDLKVVYEKITQKPRGDDFEEKGLLGRSIGERNPAGKLGTRAARAFGVVVDALGKFRCPPGTPAANQFTNERGENCFSISGVAQDLIANRLIGFLEGKPKSDSKLVSSLLSAGVSYSRIRDAYRSDGWRGLASLASAALEGGGLVGDEYDDGSYRTSVIQKVLERAKETQNTVSRTRAKSDERRKMVSDLLAKYGIPETGDNSDMVQLVDAMTRDGVLHPLTKGSDLFMGGTLASHQDELLEKIMGDADFAEYKRMKTAGETGPLTDIADMILERDRQYMRGTISGILQMALRNPDSYGKVKFSLKPERDKSGTHAVSFWWGTKSFEGHQIVINPYAVAKDIMPNLKKGESILVTATGGDSQEDHWKAIAAKLGDAERMSIWARTHMTDLAATVGNGWEDFGAEVGIHEMVHVQQFEAMIPMVLQMNGHPDARSYTPDQINDALRTLSNWQIGISMGEIANDPDLTKEVFGLDIYDLVEKRLDALAGSYSAITQQEALEALQAANELSDESEKEDAMFLFAQSVATATYETLAELGTAREMGLIEGEDVDEALSFMSPPKYAPISVPSSPSGPLSPDPTAPRPSTPSGAPTPIRPGSPGPAVPDLVDSTVSTEEVEMMWGLRPRPGRKEKTYDIVRNRRGKVPTLILDGRMTREDVEDHIFGEVGVNGKRTGGVLGQIRSIRNMSKNDTPDKPTARERRRILNALLDSLPLDEKEIERIGLDTGPLTGEDREKLEQTIAILRNAVYEYREKAEKAREAYRNYQGVSTEYDYDDYDANYRALQRLDNEARMWDALANRIGRGLAASLDDIIDIRDNGPYPPSTDRGRRRAAVPGRTFDVDGMEIDRDTGEIVFRREAPADTTPTVDITDADVAGIAEYQESIRKPEENAAISEALSSPPRTSIIFGPDGSELLSVILDDAEISRAFKENGMTPPPGIKTASKEIDRSRLIISGIDRSEVRKEIVVDVELDIPDDAEEYEMRDISIASPITDEMANRGMASRGRITSAAGMLASKRARKLLEKAGIDPERAETVQVVAQLGIAFSIGGPPAVAAQLLRMGSRDAALAGLDRAVEKGWIEPSTALRIRSMIIDRIAPDGIPQDVKDAVEASKEKVWTPENRQKAQELADAAHERVMELGERASEFASDVREKASEVAERAKERASDTADRARDAAGAVGSRLGERFRRRRGQEQEITPSLLDDPFSSTPSGDPFPLANPWDDRFKSLYFNAFTKNVSSFDSKQLGEKSRKKKVNLLLSQGQKAAFTKSQNGKTQVVLPPGKVKVTSRNEDGSINAEMKSQENTESYLKNVEKKFSDLEKNDSFDVRSRAKETSEYAKRKRVEYSVQKYMPPKSSEASRMSLEKTNKIIEDINSSGIPVFRITDASENKETIFKGISVLRVMADEIINTSDIGKEIIAILSRNSDTQIYEMMRKFAIDAHNSLDKRTRISVTKTELNQIAKNGRITVGEKPPAVENLAKIKNIMRGVANDSYSPQVVNVELSPSWVTDEIEQSLYIGGTRVGSEEFYNSDNRIKIVLRAENAQRIGYAIKPHDVSPIYISLAEDNEDVIVNAIFGNISDDENESAKQIATVLQAMYDKNYSNVFGSKGSSKVDAFIVGDISLDDIEHVKVPNTVFGYRGRIPATTPIFGEKNMRDAMRQAGVPEEKITKFFSQDGTIGGGFSPRHISYLLEIAEAQEMKEKLISSGFPDVVFTNKDGIDMLSEDTWGRSGMTGSKKGKAKLAELAMNELSEIMKKLSESKPSEQKKESVA
jgi:hypothetical protein